MSKVEKTVKRSIRNSEDPKENHLQGQHHYLELDGHRANDAIDTIQFNGGCCVPLVKNPAL